MSTKRRWSKSEKLAILQEAQELGIQETLRKHGVYPSTYYSWRKRYEASGEVGLDDHARQRADRRRIRELEDEVSLLKELLANKEVELALRDELLKKKYPWARKKS
ncbi:MAG: transposase [Bacteroidota bacterium]